MDKPIVVGIRPTVFLLPDKTELEVSFVELYEEEYEYKENERECLNALQQYLARVAKRE
ncbi:MAG: hypothetical protein MK188_05560 [Gammaproteobacteria bacterium]|nr:hypothetical protein [Gammaproteobacteria bacterium]